MDRIFPPLDLLHAPGLQRLRDEGIDRQLYIYRTAAAQCFFDFTALESAHAADAIAGLSEPVIRIGERCFWVGQLRPQGAHVVVGAGTGIVWLMVDLLTPPVAIFLNSSTSELEQCIVSAAEFYDRGADTFDSADSAVQWLAGRLIAIDPALGFDRPAAWHDFVEGVAMDMDLSCQLPWHKG